MGTIDYVAPEQARGERVDARADVYSLGCVLFTALTGSVPFDLDNDLAKLYAHDRSPAPSVLARDPALPEAFETVLARALAKAPDERYQSAGDLGRAALAAAAGSPLPVAEHVVAAGRGGAGGAGGRPRRRPSSATAAADPAAADAAAQATDVSSRRPARRRGAASQETEMGVRRRLERDDGPARRARATEATSARRGVLVGGRRSSPWARSSRRSRSCGGGGGDERRRRQERRRWRPRADRRDPRVEPHRQPVLRERPRQLGQLQHRPQAREGADAPDGSYVARVSLGGSESEYAIDDSPDSVDSSTKGDTYNAVAWVKATESTDGKPVCISIRERSAAGELVGRSTGEVTANAGEYQPVRVSHVATTDGSRIDVHVLRQGDGVEAGEVFLVDAISLIDGAGEDASPECSL